MKHLPIEFIAEYDSAAMHGARQRLQSKPESLPILMCEPGAITYIEADPEAFEERVRETCYALAMKPYSQSTKHN